MAGGEGTRLRPLTCPLPKPMVPILNIPIMEYIIKLLKRNNIEEIAVTLAYLPDTIIDYFGDGANWGVNISYFIEETPLGTGGSVRNAHDFLDDTFIVISGDALTDIDIGKSVDFHREKCSKATLVLKREDNPLEYGVIITDEKDRIIRFLEKPSWGEVFSDTINTGIYILEPEVMEYYKKGDKFDFSKDLFPKLLEDQVPMFGYISEDYWCDIGDIATYTQSQFDVLNGLVEIDDLLKNYNEIEKGVWMEGEVIYSEGVTFQPPVIIGPNSFIKNNTSIGPNCVIGSNCKIGFATSIKNSIIWNNTYLGDNVQCRGSIICNDVAIEDRVNLYQQSVVGNGAKIQSGVTINPNIKIWPFKNVEEDTIINQHLIWRDNARKILFGYRDISGLLNIDITPEFASQLGSALASTIPENKGQFIVCSDSNKGSLMVKRAISTGIISTGRGVIDIGTGHLPFHRYAIKYFSGQGGVYISGELGDPNRIHIEIMNKSGANIERQIERQIENIFNRGDFERVNNEQMSRIIRQEGFSSQYINKASSLIKKLDGKVMKDKSVVIGSTSDSILGLGSAILGSAGYGVFKVKTSGKPEEYIPLIESQIKNNSSNMGVFIYEKGDELILFDKNGEKIQQEDYQLLAYLLILKKGGQNLVVPHTFPEVIEDIAKQYNSRVIRTKSAPSEVMNQMLSGKGDERTKLLTYAMHYDGIWATAIIADYLFRENVSLAEFKKEIPKYFYKKANLKCKWEDKGRVLKEVISNSPREDLELFEGVKFKNKKGWALVLPDSEKPLFNLYVQGATEEFAEELSIFFTDKIKKLINGE